MCYSQRRSNRQAPRSNHQGPSHTLCEQRPVVNAFSTVRTLLLAFVARGFEVEGSNTARIRVYKIEDSCSLSKLQPPQPHSFRSAKSLLVEMYFSSALVLTVLPFLVAAAPFEERSRDGVSIPIAKRSGFRSGDGVVDTAKLQAGLRRTAALVFRIFLGRSRPI